MRPLALTMGEPAGIGGEIACKAWTLRTQESLPPFFLLDLPERIRAIAEALSLDVPVIAIAAAAEATEAFARGLPVLPLSAMVEAVPGKPDPANGLAVLASIERAVQLALAGEVGGIVTNPIQKSALYAAGFRHPGHTEYLSFLTGGARPVMMLAIPELRVVPVTVHVALKAAIAALTADEIVAVARIVHHSLRTQFGIARPRLAIAGLNPHAGEGGSMGTEEIEIVQPAIDTLRAGGIDVKGPYPPDTMFSAHARSRYDAAICLYHDQALIPLKTLDFERGVNVTLGLPIVRTSPDHGTALDIAGKGVASPASLVAAIQLAGRLAETNGADATR